MNSTVAFAYAKQQLPPDIRLADRPELFAVLRKFDLDPVVTLGGEAAYHPDYIRTTDVMGNADSVIDASRVGAVVNRLNRSFKLDLLGGFSIPATVNENAVRKLGWNKDIAAEQVFKPLGYSLPTALVTTPEDVDTFLGSQKQKYFITKPRHGNFGAGTTIHTRDTLAQHYTQFPDQLGKHVIQPALDLTKAFPRYVKPLDRQSTPKFEELNTAGTVKELRAYGFLSSGGIDVYPAARVLRPSLDGKTQDSEWFFVDPESLPERVVSQTSYTLKKTAQLTGSAALFGAVDFGYGSDRSSDAPADWHIIELNVMSPGMIADRQNVTVATELRRLYGRHLRSLVSSP